MSASASDDLRQFQTRLSRRLLAWSGLSLAGGALLLARASGSWAAFGVQALAWGGVDAVIAVAGLAAAARRGGPQREASRPAARLKRLLWINTLLDLLYVAAGIGLVVFLGRAAPAWRGHGWGVAVQGTFLLFFDLIHAQSVPGVLPEVPLQAFSGPEHLPFRLDAVPRPSAAAARVPGALLVHGFPGTPAEMRPLAEALHREGWSVQALLLPGFGPQIGEITSYRGEDWQRAVQGALAGMRRDHDPLLLVGYSVGGALAALAASMPAPGPNGLVLLAPFWRLGSPLQRLVGRVLAPFLPRTFQPLAKVDFADPSVLESLRQFLPGADLTDPALQRQLRQAQVPVSIVREILSCGRRAFSRGRARRLALPTLVLQGRDDVIVLPRRTRRLLRRLGRPPAYRELDAGHDLIDPRSPGWGHLVEQVKGFAAGLPPERPAPSRGLE